MASSIIPSIPVPVPVTSPNPVVYPAIQEVVLKSEINVDGIREIQTGILNFNAPSGSVTFSTPFAARPTILLQPTLLPPWSGGLEATGLFFIESADETGFVVGFSGTIAFYNSMPLMWLAVGS
jgi:hypothetical protein